MKIRYEIDANNAVSVYYSDSDTPGIFQDGDYNTGEIPFASREVAQAWAEDFIKSNQPVAE
jgi:hypothetical protein